MEILITGGAGFVGSSLALTLKSKYPDYRITAFDNLRRRGSELNLDRLKAACVDFIHGDIRNPEDLALTGDFQVLIDASADPSVLSGINSPVLPVINANLNGTIQALELAASRKAHFVFLSTSRIYPVKPLEEANFVELDTRFEWTDIQKHPGLSREGVAENFPLEGSRSFYGASKLASELLIQEYCTHKNMKAIVNRCGVISGPWQMGKIDQGVLVLWLARHYFKGSLSYIGYQGTGKQTRDVIHVDDLVDLIDFQIHNIDLFQDQVCNVGGGLENSFSLCELTRLCEEISGNKIQIDSVKENRPADLRIYVGNNAKIHELCAWKPRRNVSQLVSDTFDWLRQNETKLKNILT